jgi:acylphosphatase
MPIRRFIVSGRVQGVFYRVSACRAANEFGLTGFTRNLPDESVEVVAHGSRAALSELESWLWEGPQLAKVTGVVVEEIESDAGVEGLANFVIR